MNAIDYACFDRLLTRCVGISAEAGVKSSVVRVHDEILKSAGEAFRNAHQAVTAADVVRGELTAAPSARTAEPGRPAARGSPSALRSRTSAEPCIRAHAPRHLHEYTTTIS